MKDCLVIAFDVSKNDKPTVLVTRSDSSLTFEVVNQIWGDDAIEIYHKLIGK